MATHDSCHTMTMSRSQYHNPTGDVSPSNKTKGLSSSFHETSGTRSKLFDQSQDSNNKNEFRKSLSLDRKSKWKDNTGKDRDSQNASIHGTPKRVPPSSQTTPSLWKRIFSFKKGGFSSQKDLSTIGKYSMDNDNKSNNQDLLEGHNEKKFKKISNRLISQLRQGSGESNTLSPTRNYRPYRRTQSDVVQDGNNNPSSMSRQLPTNQQSQTNLNISALEGLTASEIDINGNVHNEVSSTKEEREMEKMIKITRYKCHPRRGNNGHHYMTSSTPPLVMFSSDEDISSQQTTPVHTGAVFSSINEVVPEKKLTEIISKTKLTQIDINSKMSSPVMRIKNQNETSMTVSPSVILTSSFHHNDKAKCMEGSFKKNNSPLPLASRDRIFFDNSADENISSVVETGNMSNLHSNKETFQCIKSQSPGNKFGANMKEEVYECSGDLPSTITPIVKPRPKVKRSVSCSPARHVRTISAELEERIGAVLRESPQRRLSNEKIISPVRNPVTILRRASASEKHGYSGSLLRNSDNKTYRRPSYLAHSKSVPFQCSSLDRQDIAKTKSDTFKVPNCNNHNIQKDKTDSGNKSTCVENFSSDYKSVRSKNFPRLGSYAKSCYQNVETVSSAECSKLGEQQLDATCHTNLHPVQRHYSTAGEGRNKNLFYTRRRHHTIELGSSLSPNVGNTSLQNKDGQMEIKKKNTIQIPLHKRGIDLQRRDSNFTINKSNRNVSSKGQDSCTLQVSDSSDKACADTKGHIISGIKNKSDKTVQDKTYHSTVFLQLIGSSENDESTECIHRQIRNNKQYNSIETFTAGKEIKSNNKITVSDDKPIVDIVTDSEGHLVMCDENASKVGLSPANKNVDYQQSESNNNAMENVLVGASRGPKFQSEEKYQRLFLQNIMGDSDSGLTFVADGAVVNPEINDGVTDSVNRTDSSVNSVYLRNKQEKVEESTQFLCSGSLFVPQCSPKQRPKSEILCVRWADETDIVEVSSTANLIEKRSKRTRKERPKSDIGGRKLVSEALQSHKDLEATHSDSVTALNRRPHTYQLPWEKNRLKQRRMSTPHPIKIRPTGITSVDSLIDDSFCSSSRAALLRRMKKCRSVPNLSITQPNKKRRTIFHASSAHAGDLALQPIEFNDTSDDEATSEETASIGAVSETSSGGSTSKHTIDQLFEDQLPTYAEALWDHVTLDLEELAFQVGEVIKVKDMTDKDWWYGVIEDRLGWFPAAFVRLHANQMDTADDFVSKVKSGHLDGHTMLQRYSSNLLSKDQARTNVVTEIINAEREYVKHLKDVVEGYVEKARKRPEMFPDTMLSTIFSNIEEIYKFSSQFLQDLEKHILPTSPHVSEIGKCFLNNNRGFEIYSEYCNNHPSACDELRVLQKNTKYKHFFEACRLLQQMIEIPLEGFLLTPVQKICKYPLQLKELLKYTRPEHPDCRNLQEALESMRHIAMLINERKRKLESVEKLAQWQQRVADWEGDDLIEESSELIFSGEMCKVNTNGWHQDRVFFLFDHQLLYCKKDLLWRDMLIYRGRINLDHCEVHSLQDGKDIVYNTNIKNGIKIYDSDKDRWYLMYCKTPELKEKWLNAFQQERHRIMQDRANSFDLEEYRKKAKQNNLRDKSKKDKKNRLSSKDFAYKLPARQLTTTEGIQYAQSHNKKSSSGFLPFLKRKIKR